MHARKQWKTSRNCKPSTAARLPMVMLLLPLALTTGCASFGKPAVLLESETYQVIPAGTPYQARECSKCPMQTFKRSADAWVVDGGYMVKLQEEANYKAVNNMPR